jgi:hypothetical protein
MSAPSEEPPRLQSNLPTSRERFLARVVDQAFDDGWRTAEDFLRHFPPQTIVQSLEKADDLRVKLLVETTGANERLALKKSVASAAEDLNLALEEDLTNPAAILALYPADDKVRYLPADALWSFYAEDGFFDTDKVTDASKHAHATKRLTFALEVALDEKLITLRDIADGITFDEIAERLPVEDLRELLKHALKLARTDLPLVEEEFHNVVPLGTLTGYVPLAHTWERVVIDKVAAPAGFCERVSSVPPKAAAAEKKKPEEEESKPPARAAAKPLPPPPAPPAAAPAAETPSEVEAQPPPLPDEPTAAADELLGSSAPVDRPAEEDAARRRVLDRLKAIERLPPSSAQLATPILLSIESMYADLATGASDDEREAVVEEAFPNETHLRTAMLALIELLDPSVDTADPVIRDADPTSLVKIVLFEERRRGEPRRSSPGAAPASASPSGPAKRRSVPPLPPRTSSAPPPPRQGSRRAK